MRLTKLEQETSIHFNEGEETADVFTYKKSLQQKLTQFSRDYPESVQYIRGDNGFGGELYKVDKILINIRQPRAKKYLTEDQRAVISERLKKGRSAKISIDI